MIDHRPDGPTRETLDLTKQVGLRAVAEADCHTVPSRPARAANAVNIDLGLVGQVDLDHVRHTVHVDAP